MSYYKLKHFCKQFVATAVRPLGFVPSKSPLAASDLLEQSLTTLRYLGFSPRHIVDIGANRGGWTRQALQCFPDAQYTVIEPQHCLRDEAPDLLERENVHWHTAGIGKESGSRMLTLGDRDDSSSFRYSVADAKTLGLKQVSVPMFTLAELLRATSLPPPDLIKIDAEGLDLDVLEGAKAYVGKTEVFYIEAGIAQREFSNNLATVVSTLQSYGYRVFDITDLNRTVSSRSLWLVELGFLRVGGPLDQAVQSYDA